MTLLAHKDFGPRDGHPVVFSGSIASTTDMWLPQLDALSDTFRVIALDHPGHGETPDASCLSTIPSLASSVLETLDSLGVDEFSVVGLSLGGAIAQWLAAHSGRVAKAVFMCTGANLGGASVWAPRVEQTRTHGVASRVDGAVKLWVTDQFRQSHPATTEALARMIASTTGEGYATCAEALAEWDFAAELSRITAPVLTIAGPDDTSTPPEVVHAIADRVGGPSQTLTLTAGGHVPTVEVPDEVNAALRGFLAR